MQYELSFTFFIRVGEDQSSQEIQSNKKNSLIDLIGKIDCISNYEIDNDGDDWCINCLASIHAKSFREADCKLTSRLNYIPFFWDYNYIECVHTMEIWQP